jgi:glutamate racemase
MSKMRVTFSAAFGLLVFGSFAHADSPISTSLKIFERATLDQQTVPYTFDPNLYLGAKSEYPIGVFDSGIGGLTVLEAIRTLDDFNNETLAPQADGKLDFANEQFVYLGDQANMPYGNYPARGKEDYLRELILKDTIFLLGKRCWLDSKAALPSMTKPPVKAIVIACNTATAYGLEDIRTALKAWQISIPVIGVVEAGARGVSESITNQGSKRNVGVLATIGTCSSLAYPKAIVASSGLAGKPVPEVVQQGSVNLANAIEANPTAIQDCIRQDIRQLVETYLQSGSKQPLDTIVLGCTHFPLVQDEIQKELNHLRSIEENGKRPYEGMIAATIEFVNPAELTAKELFRELARNRLFNKVELENAIEVDQFYISVPDGTRNELPLNRDGSLTTEYKYTRTIDRFEVEDTRCVPMTKSLLPSTSLNLIQQRLPEVWKRLSMAAP